METEMKERVLESKILEDVVKALKVPGNEGLVEIVIRENGNVVVNPKNDKDDDMYRVLVHVHSERERKVNGRLFTYYSVNTILNYNSNNEDKIVVTLDVIDYDYGEFEFVDERQTKIQDIKNDYSVLKSDISIALNNYFAWFKRNYDSKNTSSERKRIQIR